MTWLAIVCNNVLSQVPIYSLKCLESEGENPAIFCCTGRRVWFEERIHRTWNLSTGIQFMTLNRSCIPESPDNRPCNLYRSMWFTPNVPCIFAVWTLMFKNWSFKNKSLSECSVYYLVSLCVELDNVCFAEHPTEWLGWNLFICW